MSFTIRLISLIALFSLGVLAGSLDRRGIPPVNDTLLTTLKFYEQYVAASYCTSNNDSPPGAKIACPQGICSNVTAANVTAVVEFQNTLIFDTTGFLAKDTTNKIIVLAFRGSISFRNWFNADLFAGFTPIGDVCANCQAFGSMYNAWQEVRDTYGILALVNQTKKANPTFKIVVTGHSLGGALATYAATELRNSGYTVDLVSFASPRAGNQAFAAYITNQNKGVNYRITHYNDPVPNYPVQYNVTGDLLKPDYMHPSPEYYIITPNNVNVSTNNMMVYEGIGNDNGNARWPGNETDANSHGFYFANVSACYTTNIDWTIGILIRGDIKG